MGRSQVERNRTRGRPGRGKDGGRGKGGRSTTSTTTSTATTTKKKNQANHDLGSNAFRYEKKSKGTNDAYESFMMEDYSIGGAGGGNEFGPSHYSVARNLYQDDIIADTDTDTDTSIGINTMIDVTSLSECLENSYGNGNSKNKNNTLNNVNLQYLRFDDRMREIFQKRFLDGTNETTMTIAEMRLLGSGTSSSRPTTNNNDDMENLEKIQEMKIEDEKIDDDSNNNNDANKDDDDSGDGEAGDLEDWLDDMIS